MNKLIEQIHALPDVLDVLSAMGEPERFDIARSAVIRFPFSLLVEFDYDMSLEKILAHPDMPSDAKILTRLAIIDSSISVVFFSKDWEVVPEGQVPPEIDLYWKRTSKGIEPKVIGAYPCYDKSICSHCNK